MSTYGVLMVSREFETALGYTHAPVANPMAAMAVDRISELHDVYVVESVRVTSVMMTTISTPES
jgi:hypothetical protein